MIEIKAHQPLKVHFIDEMQSWLKRSAQFYDEKHRPTILNAEIFDGIEYPDTQLSA